MPALVAAGHTCIALDMYGSALSVMNPSHKDNTVQDHADDAAALLQSVDIPPGRVVAVGHSMGGLVAATLSLAFNLAGVVLIGAVTPSESVSTAFSRRIQIVRTAGMEPLADAIPTAATGSLSTPTHHAFVRALLLSQSPQGYMGMCRAIAEATTPDYAETTCPALVIAGADDKVVSVESLQAVATSWGGGSSLKVLEGVGHWHCIEAGGASGRLLVDFAANCIRVVE